MWDDSSTSLTQRKIGYTLKLKITTNTNQGRIVFQLLFLVFYNTYPITSHNNFQNSAKNCSTIAHKTIFDQTDTKRWLRMIKMIIFRKSRSFKTYFCSKISIPLRISIENTVNSGESGYWRDFWRSSKYRIPDVRDNFNTFTCPCLLFYVDYNIKTKIDPFTEIIKFCPTTAHELIYDLVAISIPPCK